MKTGRAPLLFAALCFALGVAGASLHLVPLWLPALAALLLGAAAWFIPGKGGAAALGAACLACAWAYAAVRIDTRPSTDLWRHYGDSPQSMELDLELVAFPHLKTDGEGKQSLRFEAVARARLADGELHPASGRIVCLLKNPGKEQLALDCGHRLRAYGFLARPRPSVNPGAFDYKAWLQQRGILYQFSMEGRDCRTLRFRAANPLLESSNRLRRHMLETLARGLENDPETTALTSAMLFGHRDGLGEEVEEAFRSTGTIHLFAVSGQNIAMVSGFLLLLLRVAGLIPWRWGWCLLLPLALFCLTTGSQPSAVRAVCMAGMILIGWFIGRPPNLLNAAGATALACLLWDPRQLFDLGFQLSFLVVFGLAGLCLPLYGRCYAKLAPDPWIPPRLLPAWRVQLDKAARAVCLLFAASLAAWLCSAPLILWHFSLLAPVTLAANMLVVPLATGVVYVSTLSVLGSLCGSLLPALFNQVNWLLLKTVLGLIAFLVQIPCGHFYLPVHAGYPPSGTLQITCLHGETASPTLIRHGGRNLLLDTGSADTWRYVTDPARRHFGINGWNSIFLTQGSGSHLGGAAPLAGQMPGDEWIESGKRSRSTVQHALLDFLEHEQLPKTFLRRGERWSQGPLLASCLWPPSGEKSRRLEDLGLVLLLEFKGTKILWAGDISPQIESRLLRLEPGLSADLLIQGEHSQERNLSEPWLRQLRPRFLVRPGRGYYPDRSLSPELWKWASELGIRVLDLDRTGAVTFDIGSKDKPILYSCFKSSPSP